MKLEQVQRLLIVEDDPRLGAALVAALEAQVGEARLCDSAPAALSAISHWQPELMLLDVALRDGTALDVLTQLGFSKPRPIIVAISGAASPSQAFELSRLGVHYFLPKPLDLERLETALRDVLELPPDLRPQLANVVGYRSIHSVEAEVRSTMVDQALVKSGGNVRGAARLLSISRQLLQHILRQRRIVP